VTTFKPIGNKRGKYHLNPNCTGDMVYTYLLEKYEYEEEKRNGRVCKKCIGMERKYIGE
jgi:hypothetical protein